ncbi:acyltransferase [Pedobacter duraquae]|uniref:Transferase family hexapeptide repeat protein n=1 Tax=Pedobacter duraquae TaxID=425511 RepID=A0A4R6IB51_9SPHI|nr:acyltransferase [Pedobacter duraquae]TDO19024.1 transferase family hexapeptide repeat protein [Pedobacter duraquae]
MNILSFIFRIIRKIKRDIRSIVDSPLTKIYFRANKVKFSKGFFSKGFPYLDIWEGGIFRIGENFKMNNGKNKNPIGRQQTCVFVVSSGATLIIGNNVGVSSVAIVCHNRIVIGNNVKLGGNVAIYDTDFHSLDARFRRDSIQDKKNTVTKEVIIHDDVFIGAHSTILKGVTIGKNSIIGACSVVAKSIPENEIWAGNPARFIKNIVND